MKFDHEKLRKALNQNIVDNGMPQPYNVDLVIGALDSLLNLANVQKLYMSKHFYDDFKLYVEWDFMRSNNSAWMVYDIKTNSFIALP